MISSMGTGAVATNFGGILAGQAFNGLDSRSFFSTNRRLYDSAVSGTPIFTWGARAGYQHWWTPQLRSTVDFSIHHSDVNTFYIQASGRGSNNKEVSLAHANLIWSPVAFVDLGIEGAWGHRGGIGANGGVTAEDCDKILKPLMATSLKQDKLRLYYEIGSRVTAAKWDDLRLGVGRFPQWERVAVVTDVGWVRHTVKALRF